MESINWKKYLPKKFVYKNKSIDELIIEYPNSIIFSIPTTITLLDNEQNAFTRYQEYKKKNAIYAANNRARRRAVEQQLKDYNLKLKNENKELRKIRNRLLSEKKRLMKF